MEIRGDVLTDKENAGAALLDACKEVKTSDPVQIGSRHVEVADRTAFLTFMR